jgi:hypothetical protein
MASLAQLQSKIIVDDVQEAIRRLNQVASAFDAAGSGCPLHVARATSRSHTTWSGSYVVNCQQ